MGLRKDVDAPARMRSGEGVGAPVRHMPVILQSKIYIIVCYVIVCYITLYHSMLSYIMLVYILSLP